MTLWESIETLLNGIFRFQWDVEMYLHVTRYNTTLHRENKCWPLDPRNQYMYISKRILGTKLHVGQCIVISN